MVFNVVENQEKALQEAIEDYNSDKWKELGYMLAADIKDRIEEMRCVGPLVNGHINR